MLERAVLLCGGEQVDLRHLPAEKLRAVALDARQRATSDTPPDGLSAIQIGERQRIVDALAQCAWNQTSAALLLGMPRRTLVSKLKAYGIPRPRGARGANEDAAPRSSRPRA
jgi:transcriptional regulator of acetoin/glycerol metabolism